MIQERNIAWLSVATAAVVTLSTTACSSRLKVEPDDSEFWASIRNQALVEQKRANPEKFFSYWEGDGASGSPSIRVDLSEQAAYFYKGGQLVGRSRIASGQSKFPTPTGSYTILEKKADKRSNLYGKIYNSSGKVVNGDADIRKDKVPDGGKFVGASMPYWMRLTNSGVGLHAGPIPRPGSPASHGCVRLRRDMAPIFFRNVRVGTPVRVVP